MLIALLACSEPLDGEPLDGEPLETSPPSVLLVVLDTVRADHTELLDGGKTPQLRALKEAGLTYTDATAPGPWTWPSHASLFTGEPPWIHGAHGASRDEGMALKDTLRVTPLREDLPTLAGRLAGAGYRTEAAVANRLLSQPLGLTRGFDNVRYDSEDDRVVEAAISTMGGEEPLLLFVNLMSAHSPYYPGPGGTVKAADIAAQEWTKPWRKGPGLSFFTESPSGQELYARGEMEIPPEGLELLDALYSGEVTFADFYLNRLLSAWQQARPDSVVVVTSDHGEYLGEHGFLGHSATTYREVTHVPLVLAGPGLPRGQLSDTPVQLQDVYGAILELTGVEEPPWSLARPESVPTDRPIQSAAWVRPHLAEAVGGRLAESWVTHRDGDLIAVVHGDSVELFATSDAAMAHDISAERPEDTARLAEAARALPISETQGGLPVDAATIEQLEALGYIQ